MKKAALLLAMIPFVTGWVAWAKPSITDVVNSSASFLVKDWITDPDFKEYYPPQVIPIAGGTRIFGACGKSVSGHEVGGSSYCPASHTIYLVPEQLEIFYNTFGPSSVAYVVAHEFGHAIQNRYDDLKGGAEKELQADCLAGVLIDAGSKELGITREDTIQMAQAAYAIGDPSHGTGPQRTYALLSGMGVFKSGCSNKEMLNLLRNEVKDPAYKKLRKTRSGTGSVDINSTPYPKSIGASLGI